MKKTVVTVLSSALILPGILGAVPVQAAPDAVASMQKAPVMVQSTMSSSQTMTSDTSAPAMSDKMSQEVNNEMMKVAKINKEKAVALAKAFVTIPDGYEQNQVNFNTNWYPDNRSVWQISWNKQDDRYYGNINVTIDADSGDVLGMNRYENNPDSQTPYPPKVDQAKAEDIAKQFIVKQFPKKADQVKYDDRNAKYARPPLKGNVTYYLRFVREVNGVSFNDNYISVNINGNGEMTGMDYRWNDDLTFPSTDGMIAHDDAVKQMKDSLPLQLQYQTMYGMKPYMPISKENQPTVVLVYNNIGNYTMFDAKTGVWQDYAGNEIKKSDTSDDLKPLADKPLASPPVPSSTELTQKEALAALVKKFTLPDGIELSNVSYNENWGQAQQSAWNFNWQKKGGNFWMNAAVNAKTGEVLSYSQENPRIYQPLSDDNFTQKVSYDEAKKKAMEALKELVPYKMDQLVFNSLSNQQPPDIDKAREFNFNYQRLVNGVVVPDQSINLAISAETGEVTRFYQNWNDDIKYPDPKGVVPVDKAKEAYFGNFTIEAQYRLIQPAYYNGKYGMPTTPDQNNKSKVVLVYELRQNPNDEPLYFDALKGEWVSSRTGEPVKADRKPTDISGHWAEKPLQLMIDYNAIDVDDQGKVHPDQAITRGQMVKMLMLATNPNPIYYEKMGYAAGGRETFNDVKADSPYFSYVQSAAQQGLIDKSEKEFKPDDQVTREELADLIVRALRFDKLAGVDGLFNLDFKDADQIKEKGAVAIVGHLQIMRGSDGYFRPDGQVTRAQAAVAFYQFLQKQGEFAEQGPYYY